MTASGIALHLLYDDILKFGKPKIIRFHKEPGCVGEMVAGITEAENVVRRTSATYHPQSVGLVEGADQAIQAISSKISFTRGHLDLFQAMPRAMFKGLCSFEITFQETIFSINYLHQFLNL